METAVGNVIKRELGDLFEETFTSCKGIYLDRGTSLRETLETIDHLRASKKFAHCPETIAGHTFHLAFYVDVLLDYLTGRNRQKVDWSASWKITEVSEAAWHELRESVQVRHGAIKKLLEQTENWEEGDTFGGALAILAHCSYHLAAIRQLMLM